MRKLIGVVISLILVLFCVTSASADKPKLKIGFTPPSFVSPYWTYVANAAKAEAAAEGVELIINAPKDHTDFEGQIRILEDFVQQKVDAIIIGVVDKAAVVPGLKRANAAGIPIVVPNQILPEPAGVKIDTYIGVDNFDGGKIMGEYVQKILKGKGDIVLIEGIPGEDSNDRLDGFFSVTKNYPGIKVIDRQVADWDEGKALTVMENFLQGHPKITLTFGLCDSMALGAITATKARNRLQDTIFVGYDGTKEAYESIAKGELRATIAQPPFNVGRASVISAVKLAKKQSVPLIQKLPCYLVTAENYKKFLESFEQN